MQEIDFLPADYRARTARRRGGAWRLLAAVGFLVLVAGVDIHLRMTRHAAQAELAQLAAPYLAAQEIRTQLATAQGEQKLLKQRADVLAYLRSRWPTTQLMALGTATTPAEIQLTQVRLERGATQSAASGNSFSGNLQLSASEQETRSAAALALDQLRQLNGHELLVITGTTSDTNAVRQYALDLSESPLVAAASVKSITKATARGLGNSANDTSQFELQVRVSSSVAKALEQTRTQRIAHREGTAP